MRRRSGHQPSTAVIAGIPGQVAEVATTRPEESWMHQLPWPVAQLTRGFHMANVPAGLCFHTHACSE
jgi:hypothetical protein